MAFLVPRASLAAISFLLGRRVQAQTCYYPDQTVETSHIICNASAEISLCCQDGAVCLTSGLCFSKWDTSINTGTCTDKTWTDRSCFQSCPQSTTVDHGFNTLYRCNDNRWCCSTSGNTTSCCNDHDVDLFLLGEVGAVMGGTGFQTGFTIAPLERLQTSQSTVATGQSTAAKSQSTGFSSTLSQTQSTELAGQNVDAGRASSTNTTETGLGAGLGVGLPLLAGLIVALLFLRRLRSQTNSIRTDSGKEIKAIVTHSNTMAPDGPVEMETRPSEMPNSRREITQELGA